MEQRVILFSPKYKFHERNNYLVKYPSPDDNKPINGSKINVFKNCMCEAYKCRCFLLLFFQKSFAAYLILINREYCDVLSKSKIHHPCW